jgi:hypothetical protein
MINSEDEIYHLLEDMIRKGLASTSNTWIELAVQRKHPRLSVGIACSMLLTYDLVDRKLPALSNYN